MHFLKHNFSKKLSVLWTIASLAFIAGLISSPSYAREISPPLKALTPKFDTSLKTQNIQEAPVKKSQAERVAVKETPVKESAVKESADQKLAKEYLRHGAKLHKSGHHLIAESFFKKSIKLDSLNPDGYFNLGALYEGKGAFDSALDYYEQGLQIAPADQELSEAAQHMRSQIAQNNIQNRSIQIPVSAQGQPFQLKSRHDQTQLNNGQNAMQPPVVSVGQTIPRSKKFNSTKTKAILGMLIRTGLNIGIRAALGSGGCGGSFGF